MRKSYKTIENILLEYIYVQMKSKDVLSKAAVETRGYPTSTSFLNTMLQDLATLPGHLLTSQSTTC